jgi:hypothetical protein
MQISITGHHVVVTDSMRAYVHKKMDRIVRHFDQLIDVANDAVHLLVNVGAHGVGDDDMVTRDGNLHGILLMGSRLTRIGLLALGRRLDS